MAVCLCGEAALSLSFLFKNLLGLRRRRASVQRQAAKLRHHLLICIQIGEHDHLSHNRILVACTSGGSETDAPPAASTAAEADLGFKGIALNQPLLRSEEHTSELPSLMRKPYAVSCLKHKT